MTGGWRRWWRPARDIGLIAGLLYAVSFLPADTSLHDRQQHGVLRFCVPDVTHPLLSDSVDRGPGPEAILVQRIADALSLQLQVVEISNMRRSFNPRDWHVSRAACDILGGGLADSETNRGFLTMIPTGAYLGMLRTGSADLPARGTEMGIHMGNAGLDRVRLSAWMRSQGWKTRNLSKVEDLSAWIGAGKPALVSTLVDLPPDVPHQPLVEIPGMNVQLALGMWKGDMTLIRAVRTAMAKQTH